MDNTEFNFEEFRENCRANPTPILKAHTAKQLAKIIDDANITTLAIGSLETKSKPDLLKIIVQGEQAKDDQKQKPRVGSSDNKETARDIVSGAEELKDMIQGKPLNARIKKRAEAVVHNYLDQKSLDDDNIGAKFGVIGKILTVGALAIDVFIGFDRIKDKLKERKEAKKEADKPKEAEKGKEVVIDANERK